jgi:hypothetical protein
MDTIQILEAIVLLLGYIIAYLKTREVKNVQDFFDPESPVIIPPKNTPTQSYMMSDSVRAFLICGESPADQATMLTQVDEAEAAGKIRYVVTYSKGYYQIEYGQIRGGAKGE